MDIVKTLLSGKKIVEQARQAKRDFGKEYPKKYGGAVAVEILRKALQEEGIITSKRDVFVRGISCEFDLIIPLIREHGWMDLLYEPNQVLIALEVKKTGTFAKSGRDNIKKTCDLLKTAGIKYAYVSFEERENYKYRPTKEICGCECFNLAWHKQSDGPLEDTGDWQRLVGYLRQVIAG
jgi:hypothetical protein